MSGPSYSYATGTISISNGSAALAGVGTAWSTTVKQGDRVYAKLSEGGSPERKPWRFVGFVDTVDSNLAITLQDAYEDDDLDDALYRIGRGIAWLSGAAANETLITMITELAELGLCGVSSGVPDNDEGRENELRVDETSGIIYQKRAGVWVVAASGFSFDAYGYTNGSPSDRDQYDTEALGFTFFSISEVGFYVKLSASSGHWSELISIRGPSGAGDIFAVSLGISGRPTEGEIIPGHVFADDIDFPTGLTGSYAKARVAPTAAAEIEIHKNGVEVASVTFALGSQTGVFSAPSPLTFVAGDELDFVCPTPRDATLDGIKITLRGTR